MPTHREHGRQVNDRYLPPGVRLVRRRPHRLTERTLHTAGHNMVEGIALVLLTLFLFWGWATGGRRWWWRWRCRLSLLGAFLFLDLKGIPANLISMGAIDFGIIVDSAVVVMENLLRILEERKGRCVL